MSHRKFNCQLHTHHHNQNHQQPFMEIMLRTEIKTFFSENARKNESRGEVPKGENTHPLRGADSLIAMHTSVLSPSYAWMIFSEQS